MGKRISVSFAAMNDFLNELKQLLEKHNATIVHSAAPGNPIVVSVMEGDEFIDTEFDEDISKEAIQHHWYTPIRK